MLLYGLLTAIVRIFGVRRSRGDYRPQPIGRGNTPAIGTDRGRQCCPKNGHFGPFRPRIAHFSHASISIANRNRPRSSLLPRGNFNWDCRLVECFPLATVRHISRHNTPSAAPNVSNDSLLPAVGSTLAECFLHATVRHLSRHNTPSTAPNVSNDLLLPAVRSTLVDCLQRATELHKSRHSTPTHEKQTRLTKLVLTHAHKQIPLKTCN